MTDSQYLPKKLIETRVNELVRCCDDKICYACLDTIRDTCSKNDLYGWLQSSGLEVTIQKTVNSKHLIYDFLYF